MPRHTSFFTVLAVFFTGMAICTNSLALNTDRKQPLKVEADKASIHKKTGTSTYTGHVLVRQGSMRIQARKLTVYTRQGKLEKMVARGRPASFEQRPENRSGNIKATAKKMTFHADRNIIVFENEARLQQDLNTFTSKRIVYNVNTDTVDAGEKNGGNRVTITIQPKSRQQNRTPVKPLQ
ncbi:MAG TPA: lipopolysaccharide transport periplasmic protein LptA [Gammaproteobacteria bacterium]|nr:lipopolysaccharide transport periplasmic protein LptA [Gammaproteobacteria bacterium]